MSTDGLGLAHRQLIAAMKRPFFQAVRKLTVLSSSLRKIASADNWVRCPAEVPDAFMNSSLSAAFSLSFLFCGGRCALRLERFRECSSQGLFHEIRDQRFLRGSGSGHVKDLDGIFL